MAEQMLRIATRMGPVGLRERRRGNPMEMQVGEDNGKAGQKLVITQEWLAKFKKKPKEGADAAKEGEETPQDSNEKIYHRAIKQAMLIAARTVDINDGLDPPPQVDEAATSEELVYNMQLQEKQTKLDEYKTIIEKLKRGQEPISIAGHKRTLLKEILETEERPREMLVKFSKRGVCYQKRHRYFIIEDGTLVYYKNRLPTAKACYPELVLAGAETFTETLVKGARQEPEFEPGFETRIRCIFKERKEAKKNPLYLYPKDKKQLNDWKRTFSLAKQLVSDNDRRTIRTAIGRSVNALLIKGWESLFWYQKEMKNTRALVQQMSMRLIKVDISRGWTKMKLLWTKDKNEQKRRLEVQEFAARFLSERLARLGQQAETPLEEVKESVVTKIQERFRNFRQEAIFDRKYPITPKQQSRMQQAMAGIVKEVALEALECEDVLNLTISAADKRTWAEIEIAPEQFKTQVSTYSETYLNPGARLVSVSDNLQALTFAGKIEGLGFAKADMSNFVNLDRISTVVMNTAPQMSISSTPGKDDEGVWCSIYGPRVGWGKRIDATQDKDTKRRRNFPVGAKDAFSVPRALGGDTSTPLQYAKVTVNIKAPEWDLTDPKKQKQPKKEPEDDLVSSKLIVHVLGYRFVSDEAQGDNKSFTFNRSGIPEAFVPIAGDDDAASAILDISQVAVEVVQKYKPKDVEKQPVVPPYSKQVLVASAPLGNVFGIGVGGSKKADYQGKNMSIDLPLMLPDAGMLAGKNGTKGKITLDVVVNIQQNPNVQQNRPISPELYGTGIPTSLYTSHKGAWFDTNVGIGRFRLDRVASYVELNLKHFKFPAEDKVDKEICTYRIRAKVNGVVAVSPPMNRCKESWGKVLGHFADPSVISFEGVKLCVPLPPGCYKSMPEDYKVKAKRTGPEARPMVEIEVVKAPPHQTTTKVYTATKKHRSIFDKPESGPIPAPKDTVVYYSAITFDEAYVDETHDVSVFLGDIRAGKKPIYVTVEDNNVDGEGKPTEGVLNLEFTLRDRETVRATGGKTGKERTVCVGDKALMEVEEPLHYPASKQELRMRYGDREKYKWADGEDKEDWPKVKSEGKEKSRYRGAKLRDPAISSEYAASGLGNQVPKVKFRPGVIPAHCQDIFPHKFALPYTETEFIDARLPGVWPSILDDLVDDLPEKAKPEMHASLPKKPVVQYLKRHVRSVPVTVLAVYPDGTCAVEIAPSFMESWRRQPSRKYNMPGEYVEAEGLGKDAKLNGKNITPKEKGVGELKRAILKKVPTITLRAMHSTGFHTYNADFKDLKDYARASAPVSDFNPMAIVEENRTAPDSPSRSKSLDDLKSLTKSSELILPAGPLPPDASPAACQYEWILHVRSKNAHEMNCFVAMLQQCVRLEHFTTSSRMQQALLKQPVLEEAPKKVRMVGGQLEVVLVEARRLPPVGVQEVVHKAKEHIEQLSENFEVESSKLNLKGTTSGSVSRSTPMGAAINTFVNFKLWSDGKVMPLKGQNVQHSPVIANTSNPCWALDKATAGQGGFTFRTGHIDTEKLGDAFIEFEVSQELLGTTQSIGVVHLQVTKAPCLVDPDNPFKDCWLPLTKKVTTKNGESFIKHKTGEIHVMTRWVTAEQAAMGTPMPVKSQLLKELWPKINAQRIKEPIYQIEPQYWHYNPNLVREREEDHELDPETPPEFMARNTVELYNAMKYAECLEKRQMAFWDAFMKRLGDAGHPVVHVGDLRTTWMHRGDHAHLNQLNELIEAGIPSVHREQRWLELSGATYVMYGDRSLDDSTPEQLLSAARTTYQNFVSMGLPQSSDANKQLAEDSFHLSGWETGCPAPQEAVDFHLRRIKQAQKICTALIADEKANMAYCESLLVLAFFLSLPQGCCEKPGEVINLPMDDSSAYWLLRTLANGAFEEYYAKPRANFKEGGGSSHDSLCVSSGAMDDIFMLECCLCYHASDLWYFFHRIGFQLSTVFYGAFMRLFCTYMPTATVFRFWDILIAYSTEAHAHPHHRAYLIDLAFGVLRSITDDLLKCESAFEVKTCILGAFGAIYDMSSVVDITLHAHKFLWGGTGVAAGQVQHLYTQRHELFRRVDDALHGQNDLLKLMCHDTMMLGAGMIQTASSQRGAITKDVGKFMPGVIDTLHHRAPQNLLDPSDQNKEIPIPRYWAMHRPRPLVAKYLCEGLVHRTFTHLKEMLRGQDAEDIPKALLPPFLGDKNQERAKLVYPDADPTVTSAAVLREVFNGHCNSWSGHTEELWLKFTNRVDFEAERVIYHREQRDPYAGEKKFELSNLFGLIKNGPKEYVRKQKALIAKLPGEDQREKISMNEIFSSMVLCSKGTLGDKANNLFNIYSYISPYYNPANPPLHRQPIAKVARSITGAQDSQEQRSLAAPEPEQEKDNALHFTVYSNYPTRHTLVGDIYIQSLGQFIAVDPEYAEYQSYNIWGPKPDDVQKMQPINNKKGSKADLNNDIDPRNPNAKPGDKAFGQTATMDSKSTNLTRYGTKLEVAARDKVCLGEVDLAIAWVPGRVNEPHKGQLMVRLKAMRFYKLHITDPHKKNPYVELRSYRKGKEVSLPKWDIDENRYNVVSNTVHNITHRSEPMKWRSPYGEGIFGSTGDNFKKGRAGHDAGWTNADGGQWVWSEKEGKQYSSKDYEIDERYLNLAMRKNVMDMMGVRNLVCTILNRSVLQLSNRQQILIADSVFNRGGAVPGILEAFLCSKGSCPDPKAPTGNYVDTEAVRWSKEDVDKFSKCKKQYCTNEVSLEHERQISITGSLNMFKPGYFTSINLKTMGIKDSFGLLHHKVLWIKYIRGGDGETCMQGVEFDMSGRLQDEPKPEILMDLVDSWPQTKITKDEFISCMLNSSLLGESIRRLGATDHSMHPRKSIALDVTIMDPHHMEVDDMFQDAINVQQSILLEIWDADVVSKDFLGECWLPPLSELTSQEKDYVLRVKPADFSEEADRGPSRKPSGSTSSKDVDQSSTDPNKRIKGDLYVRMAWVFPAYEIDEATGECRKKGEEGEADEKKDDAPTVTDRAEIQEKLHTGSLTLKILKAKDLRRADGGRLLSRDCDPQVYAWQRNDVTQNWREKYLARTTVVKNNKNPVWTNEFPEPFEIVSGDFESRNDEPEEGFVDKVKDFFKSSKTKRYEEEDEAVEKLNKYGDKGLKVKFAEKESDVPGMSIIADKKRLEAERSAQELKPGEKDKDKKDDKETDGTNHDVEVYLGDSIREFKAKCTLACEKEFNYWKKRGDTGKDKAAKYADVKIGFKHIAMAFVPTPKVSQLAAQKLTSGKEYHHAYHIAFNDPSNWQPLDPARTFQQFPQFGFGRSPQPQMIKIVEATESYRLVNLRYKLFEQETNRPVYFDTNTSEKCFGYAKYFRKNELVDPKDTSKRNFEWKPAFISIDDQAEEKKPETKGKKGKEKEKFKIQWLLQSHIAADDKESKEPARATDGMQKIRSDYVETDQVMFVPRCAWINDNFLEEHRAVLEGAKELRKIGKNDFEIQKILNDMLVASADKERRGAEKTKVPPITVDIIRSFIQFTDAKASGSQGSDAQYYGAKFEAAASKRVS